MLPREPTDETDNIFRAENVLKRNVAIRQPARDVRRFYGLEGSMIVPSTSENDFSPSKTSEFVISFTFR